MKAARYCNTCKLHTNTLYTKISEVDYLHLLTNCFMNQSSGQIHLNTFDNILMYYVYIFTKWRKAR